MGEIVVQQVLMLQVVVAEVVILQIVVGEVVVLQLVVREIVVQQIVLGEVVVQPDGRRQTALTKLGIPISGLAIHPVVKMASFSLSFEMSQTPAGQVPAERVQLSRTS